MHNDYKHITYNLSSCNHHIGVEEVIKKVEEAKELVYRTTLTYFAELYEKAYKGSKMDITIRVQPEEFITKELQWYIKAKLPEIVNEYFFQNPAELNKVIREVLRGQLKATWHEIFQGKELKEILTQRVLSHLEVNDESL